MHTHTQQFERLVRTPGEAASLVAGGCGCSEENRGSFALESPDAPVGDVTWSGVIGTEGELTGDGRLIELNALRWESNLPAPLRYSPVDNGGHDGAVVVGRILTVERRENGDLWGTGDIDMQSEFGPEAARVIDNETNNGVSMDLDDVSFEIRIAQEMLDDINDDLAEDPPQLEAEEPGTDDEGRVTVVAINSDDEVFVTTDARVRAATIVAIPAFANARINLDSPLSDRGDDPEEAALVAAAVAIPSDPPAAWFSDPVLPGPTPISITDDGRIYGHLAAWGTCHTAYTGQCVEPPHSPSDYAHFRLGATRTAEGTEVPTGVITMDTLHAGQSLSANDTIAHYEHTGRAVADVVVGEDSYGIWISGALRPGLSEDKVRSLRAAPLSGDWRTRGGNLELVAALAVNTPGFPVPRPQGLAASGAMQSLVAAGVLAPTMVQGELISLDEEALMERMALRLEDRARRRDAATALASRVSKHRAMTLARRVGVR